MMRVPEAVEALGGKVPASRIYYGIKSGRYRGVRVGGVLVVDVETITDAADHDRPGLCNRAQLQRALRMTRRQVDNLISSGVIVPAASSGRKLYDAAAARAAVEKIMRGGASGGHVQRSQRHR